MHTHEELRQLQACPLDIKIALTKNRIREWVREFGVDGVYLSWSGGKDSTVLRHIIMQNYPEIESVFINTGLEYPEIQQFVSAAKNRGEPVTILHPEMRFDEVIKRYGYPIISKTIAECIRKARKNIEVGKIDTRRVKNMFGIDTKQFDFSRYRPLLSVDFLVSEQCCDATKKRPMFLFEDRTGKKPIMAMLASESQKRKQGWLKTGCNAFGTHRPSSNPMAFWTTQDVLEYIKIYDVEIPSVYGHVKYADEPDQMRIEEILHCKIGCDQLITTGCNRTGCIFCGFGAHLEKGESRFERLKHTHPIQYVYCIGGGEYNDKGLWQPNKNGLGMKHVFDTLNQIYGDRFVSY